LSDLSQPILSALAPTRGRAESLRLSVDSLAPEKNGVEVLIWADDDDPQLDQYRKFFSNRYNTKLFVKPRVGYKNFHLMINFLASQSSGDWLWLWNDDVYMGRTDWFGIFNSQAAQFKPRQEPLVFNIQGEKNGFPILSRKYYEVLGHISGNTLCDYWTRRVVEGTDIHVHIPGIRPTHRKYGDDAKHGDLIDDTYRDVETLRARSRFFGSRSPSVSKAQLQDRAKIAHWLKRNKTTKAIL